MRYFQPSITNVISGFDNHLLFDNWLGVGYSDVDHIFRHNDKICHQHIKLITNLSPKKKIRHQHRRHQHRCHQHRCSHFLV